TNDGAYPGGLLVPVITAARQAPAHHPWVRWSDWRPGRRANGPIDGGNPVDRLIEAPGGDVVPGRMGSAQGRPAASGRTEKEAAMEYLLDVQWTDPVAKAVARVLSALPDGIEATTASVPVATTRGFTVLRADDWAALQSIVHAIADAGADVRIAEREAA